MGKIQGYLRSDASTCDGTFGMCFDASTCFAAGDLSASRMATCWKLTVALFAIGIFLLLVSEMYGDPGDRWWSGFFCKAWEQLPTTRREEDSATTTTKNQSPFVKTKRSEANFCKSHDDPTLEIPSPYGPEYQPTSIQESILPIRGFRPTHSGGFMFRSKSALTVCMGSLAMALICSSASTLLWMSLNYEDACLPANDGDDNDEGSLAVFFEEITRTMVALVQGFVFFPIFLLVGYVTFISSRWRDWMVNCHAMQGNIHDIGVLVGGSFVRPPTMEQRQLLYKIYRHLNAVHALCYKTISESLCHLELDDFDSQLGLLTQEELKRFSPYPAKTRDAVLTRVTSEIAILCQADNMVAPHGELLPYISNLRARTARHHDLFVRDNPNLYLNLMFYVVNVLIFFTIVSYPFTLMLHTPASFPYLPCFQPGTLLGVFLVLFSYRAAFSMICRLRNPFSWTEDRIQVDMLLASTDMCLFTVLRDGFESDANTSKKETRRRQEEEPETFQENDQKLRASFDNKKTKRRVSHTEDQKDTASNEPPIDTHPMLRQRSRRPRPPSEWSKQLQLQSSRRLATVDEAIRRPNGEYILELGDCRET